MAALKTIDEYAGRVDTTHDLLKEQIVKKHEAEVNASSGRTWTESE